MLLSTILLSGVRFVSVFSFCGDGTIKRQSVIAGVSSQQFVGRCFGGKCVDYSCYIVYLNDYYNW